MNSLFAVACGRYGIPTAGEKLRVHLPIVGAVANKQHAQLAPWLKVIFCHQRTISTAPIQSPVTLRRSYPVPSAVEQRETKRCAGPVGAVRNRSGPLRYSPPRACDDLIVMRVQEVEKHPLPDGLHCQCERQALGCVPADARLPSGGDQPRCCPKSGPHGSRPQGSLPSKTKAAKAADRLLFLAAGEVLLDATRSLRAK